MANNKRSLPLPAQSEYYRAVVAVLKELEDAVSVEQMESGVAARLSLTKAARQIPQPDDTRTKFQYDLAWSRTRLKQAGILENIERGLWRLTP
ncbi:MAG: winged helix-turn-helix domain-containing protein, partial [Devosia sp.]